MKCARPECTIDTSGNSKYCSDHKKVARELWKQMITEKAAGRKTRDHEYAELYARAHSAGMQAATNHIPTPMVVYTPKDVMASFGNDNQPQFVDDKAGGLLVSEGNIDLHKPVYTVNEGVCGFAWVNIRPGTHPFVHWLKKTGKIEKNARSYYGGVDIWVHEFGQSMERKMKYARAFAHVLSAAGIPAHPMDRID